MKKIDKYTVKTFFGPFFFIFTVLSFIFLVNVLWVQMSQFTGKGLTYGQLAKFFLYMSAQVVKLSLPMTVLLASLMTFGDFGERYELAAMKSAGISLLRIMAPLFIVVSLLALLLYWFSNNISPDTQKKARNMMYNIRSAKPALNFTAGQFITSVPDTAIKFDSIWGENSENLKGIFIHKTASMYQNQQTVVAKTGKFVPPENKNFIKLMLFSGYIYEDMLQNKTFTEREKQPDQSVKFDTLVAYFDVSDVLNKAIEEERITNDYQFETYIQLNKSIKIAKTDNNAFFWRISNDLLNQTNTYITLQDSVLNKKKAALPFKMDTLKKDKKLEILRGAYRNLESAKLAARNRNPEILGGIKYFARVVVWQQKIVAYSFTCLIFLLIGASIGSSIRKGGLGLPVVITIVIFVIYYIINMTTENLAWNGVMNPYFASWLPNLILLIFGIWLIYKAQTDSQIFDFEKYKTLTKPVWNRFIREKQHERYQ